MEITSAFVGQEILIKDKDGSTLNKGRISRIKRYHIDIEWLLPYGKKKRYTKPFSYYKASKKFLNRVQLLN